MEICLPAINSVELTQEWMSEFMKYNQCDYAWERDCVDENKTQHEVPFLLSSISKYYEGFSLYLKRFSFLR